jgi:hypothetical protein
VRFYVGRAPFRAAHAAALLGALGLLVLWRSSPA